MAAVGEILQGMSVLLTIAVVVAQIAGGVACREGEGERKEKRWALDGIEMVWSQLHRVHQVQAYMAPAPFHVRKTAVPNHQESRQGVLCPVCADLGD